ncbi:MAG: TIGR02217 family protein [Planctomycetes bacterium]|nr:TIGR02217 family protein [Planctomycetota bacterium]
MAFHEVQFPIGISYGSGFGPAFSTNITETDSGQEERIARWANARRRYDVREAIKSRDDIYTIQQFYIVRGGAANGFRFKDFTDFSSASNGRGTPDDEDQSIGTGDASEVSFQLTKQYVSGIFTRNRNITKPVSGTVVVALDTVAKTEGVDFTVDTTSGLITFTAAPGGGAAITAGFEFDVPVRFGKEADDQLLIAIDSFDITQISSLPLIEIRDEDESGEDAFQGGAADLSVTADTQLSVGTGRTINLSTVGAGLDLILPVKTNLPGGGPYFFVFNNGANTITVVDSPGGSTVLTIAAGTDAEIVLGLIGAAKTWFALT